MNIITKLIIEIKWLFRKRALKRQRKIEEKAAQEMAEFLKTKDEGYIRSLESQNLYSLVSLQTLQNQGLTHHPITKSSRN